MIYLTSVALFPHFSGDFMDYKRGVQKEFHQPSGGDKKDKKAKKPKA